MNLTVLKYLPAPSTAEHFEAWTQGKLDDGTIISIESSYSPSLKNFVNKKIDCLISSFIFKLVYINR